MATSTFPLGFDVDEMVDDTLTDTCTFFDDNCMSSVAQVQFPANKSPFHESDSGLSDITGFSSASPSRDPDIMLDELIDNKQFTPFGFQDFANEDDKDLVQYLQQNDEIDVVKDSSDIQKFLARRQSCKENELAVPSSTRGQAAVRQGQRHCGTEGGAAGPMTRQRATQRVSSTTSNDYSELSKAVSVIENDSDAADTGDDEDYLPKCTAKKAKGSVRIAKPVAPIMKQNLKSQLSNIRCVASEPSTSGMASVKVLQVVRTGAGENTADEVIKALEDRNRKNAEQARVNRQKKKAYVEDLQQKVEESQAQVDALQRRLKEEAAEKNALKEEVEYLKAVLANQSALAGLLKNIPCTEGVSLTSSFVSRKRSAEMDHSYTPSKKQCSRPLSSAGVCLHVDCDKVSLEFCHHCARNAKGVSSST